MITDILVFILFFIVFAITIILFIIHYAMYRLLKLISMPMLLFLRYTLKCIESSKLKDKAYKLIDILSSFLDYLV